MRTPARFYQASGGQGAGEIATVGAPLAWGRWSSTGMAPSLQSAAQGRQQVAESSTLARNPPSSTITLDCG